MPAVLALLAHQGGWDEILLVGGPIIVIVALLAVAKRRVDAAAAADVGPVDADQIGSGQDEPAEADG